MKGFVCGVCGFIAIDGRVPEKCPVCGAAKDVFAEKDDAVKTAANVAMTGESEKKHVPAIRIIRTCGLFPGVCVDVTVTVGEIPHPMLPEHHITRIDCYVDRAYVARVSLTPGVNPAAGLHVKTGGGTFTAIEHCNLHGCWMSEAAL
jgi:desulfoferrodoxin-like iron-binding protein